MKRIYLVLVLSFYGMLSGVFLPLQIAPSITSIYLLQRFSLLFLPLYFCELCTQFLPTSGYHCSIKYLNLYSLSTSIIKHCREAIAWLEWAVARAHGLGPPHHLLQLKPYHALAPASWKASSKDQSGSSFLYLKQKKNQFETRMQGVGFKPGRQRWREDKQKFWDKRIAKLF